MLRFTHELQAQLLALPESGMGYQLVDAIQFDGRIVPGIAYNAELLLSDDERRGTLASRSYAELMQMAGSAEGKIKDVRRRQTRTAATKRVSERSVSRGGAAEDAPLEQSKVGEEFIRFSAYANDKRVRPDKSLERGSYATTQIDAHQVKTGTQAVERYALPNRQPASYRLRIVPTTGTAIQRGIAQPNYGQPGGGAEIIFPGGTQPSSVSTLPKLPD